MFQPNMSEADLRDYFAAAALTGILADPTDRMDADARARFCYTQADAMLAERRAAFKRDETKRSEEHRTESRAARLG